MMEYSIKRTILAELEEQLPRKEISLITGGRQVGKTTLMKLLQEKLDAQGEITLFLSLDFEKDRPFFGSQTALLKKIELEIGRDKRGFVFIDEIQRKEDAGFFLKGLYDMDLPYKFIVSGSGSLELKEKIHESLAGRKKVFEVGPVSFEEFLHFKTDYKYETKFEDFLEIEKSAALMFLSDYLQFGGYPRVILEERLSEKIRTIDDIFRSYVERDIEALLRIEKSEAFVSLMKLLASQVGHLINYNEFSSTLGISVQTVKKYLWYAEKTFTIQKSAPYFKNRRKEITKSPKIFFSDCGLMNYANDQFGQVLSNAEWGAVFENFMYGSLKKKLRYSGATIHFWRTKDGAEVDFLINRGKEVIPVEAKYKEYDSIPPLDRSIRSYIHKYSPSEFYVINKNFRGETRVDKTKIIFVPFWDLSFSNL